MKPHALYRSIAGRARRFRRLLLSARQVQRRPLRSILAANARSAYGRRFRERRSALAALARRLRAALLPLSTDDDADRGLVEWLGPGAGREHRQLRDRDVLAVGRQLRRVEQRVVLERDVARDLVEVVDQPRGGARTEAALERRHAAQDPLQHVDVLALSFARVRSPTCR